MKLLFDANPSPSLVAHLRSHYPASLHVRDVGLEGGSDAEIWEHAKARGFIIVSKDTDVRERSFIEGFPPKVVWLDPGNAGTIEIANRLRVAQPAIATFLADPEESLLVISSDGHTV